MKSEVAQNCLGRRYRQDWGGKSTESAQCEEEESRMTPKTVVGDRVGEQGEKVAPLSDV